MLGFTACRSQTSPVDNRAAAERDYTTGFLEPACIVCSIWLAVEQAVTPK